MKRFSTLLFGSTVVFLFLFIIITYVASPKETSAQVNEIDGVAGNSLYERAEFLERPWIEPSNDSSPYRHHVWMPVAISSKEEEPGDDNNTNYGDPDHPPYQHADDTFEITFAVTGDPQFEHMYNYDYRNNCGNEPSDKLLRSQKTVSEMNQSCKNADPECIGAFVAGDLTQTQDAQDIIAFRQMFEYGYPGEDGGSIVCTYDAYYHRYSWGHKLGYPMFALIGNHDDPTHDENHPYVQDYLDDLAGYSLYDFPIEKRFSGTVPSNFYKGNYAWEWGSFHFISLGLWAFYDGYDDGYTSVDQHKIDWLKEYLAAVGHEQAIVLFQHFGWDSFSFKWWSHDNADQLINVLCNRDSSDEPCGTQERPKYNVIGIFSGHNHEVGYKKICAERDSYYGTCVVAFDNYIVNDAGPVTNGAADGTGYTMVHLNVWPEGYPRHTEQQMTVTNYNLTNLDEDYKYDGSLDGENKTSYDLITDSAHHKGVITTGFTTWDQGEPNGGIYENCATFKANGRFNDLDCTSKLRFVCHEIDPEPPHSSELLLLTAEDAGEWEHGEFVCEDSGENRSFSLPKSFEEQMKLTQMINDSGDSSPVWVNESDQIEEGHWITYPQDYFYFEPGQPNDGSHIPQHTGHGEDCAVINKDGLLEDRRCENEMHSYVCKDHDGWYIHSEKGMWKQAFDVDKCGEHGFKFPADVHEYNKMVDKLMPDLEGSAWIGLNDLTEEGNWANVTWMQKCWGEEFESQVTLPSDTARQISAGNDFSCGIRQDGTVKCWGDNASGVLDPPEGVFLQISAGNNHVCGVRSDKTVACWGENDFGKLDAPPGKNFHQVSVGNEHSCGINIDGKLTCWGDSRYDQLDAPTGNFRQISAGFFHTCGVDEYHALQCWGDNRYGQKDAPPDAFRQVSAGQWHTCGILMNSNEVTCWGNNWEGQLDAPSGTFLKIDAGYWHSCGLLGTLPHSQFEGHWKLDEGSGTIATDSSPNGYDGSLVNSPTWSSDIPKSYFDNSHSLKFKRAEGDAVLIPGTTNIDNLSEFTISTWVKLTGMPDDTVMRFVTLGNEKASLRYDGGGGVGGPGQLHFFMKDESGTFHNIRKDGALSSGHWLHIVGTYDGSTMRLYLNGVEQGSTEVSGQVKTGNGVRLSDSGGEGLDGRLDDVRIYNRALVPTEIQALAARNQASSGTLACWGNNTNGQLEAPYETFDQVNAGGFHSCSIKSFVHPWEDDFAPGQKYDEAEDCAELYTYLENGRQTGKLRDSSCDVDLDHFACKSSETGDWKITRQYDQHLQWGDGFDRCQEDEFGEFESYEWRFDAPISEADHERLTAAIWEQVGENAKVGVNYSDARIEGLWRSLYWEGWLSPPEPGSGNCTTFSTTLDMWEQVDCGAMLLHSLCDRGVSFPYDRYYMPNSLATGEEANRVCSDEGTIIAFPFSPREHDKIQRWVSHSQPTVKNFWIRYTDLDYEGQWEDWTYGD